MAKSGARDFDFLIGKWMVDHRRLKERLSNCAEWESGAAVDTVREAFLGHGNVDCFRALSPGQPFEGMSIRLFSPETNEWSIYWADSVGPKVDPPVRGVFKDGVGVFIGDHVWNGRPVKVRFVWSDITATSARWEQAFSADGGETWEVNSIMEFRRVQAFAEDCP